MPRTLHAELAARSDAEGVSLNQFIVAALSRAASTDGTESEGSRPPARPMSSTLRLALIANAVVVALAAATAIALIVIAWR
jgi:hypothetical protein